MPAGHPTDYKIEYCEMLINHMAQGYSFESFGADAHCAKDTLYEWVKVHPEFSYAKSEGTLLSLKWHESVGQKGMMGLPIEVQMKDKHGNIKTITGKNFNPVIFKFMMANKHGWKDRSDVTSADEKIEAPRIILDTHPIDESTK